MAQTIQVLYAASLQALWLIVEKSTTDTWNPVLLAVAWSTSWFIGYSVGARLAPKARGRRLLTLTSSIAGIIAYILLARGADPLVIYLILTFSLALAISAVIAAIVNEDDYAGWREGILKAKALTALAAPAFAAIAAKFNPAILVTITATLALLAIPRFWDPVISSSRLKLLDKFADEALAVFRARPTSTIRLVESLALATGILAVLRIAELTESSHPLTPLAHSGGLALGALFAMLLEKPLPGLTVILALAGSIVGMFGLEPLDMALLSFGHGYADTALLVAALEVTPTGAPRYTFRALAWMLPGALILILLSTAGLSLEESASLISIALLVAMLRRRSSWT